ncbi:MAG: tripartite tricarboxylate transporter TctB family protein [Xanthobacteraceae bacterium]
MKSIPAPMTFVMLAIFVVMVGIATTYPPDARFMTFVAGVPAIGLCLLQLGLDFYRRRRVELVDHRTDIEKAEDQASRFTGRRFEMPSENVLFTESTHSPRETVRREIVVWAYFLGFIAAILLLGFRISVPTFLVMFLRFQAGTSWRNALIFGGAGSLAMYLLFEKILRVSLHTGFLIEYVIDLIGR